MWWAPQTDVCVYCRDSVPPNVVAVMWAGAEHLLLHRECVAELGSHLIADAREAALASGEGNWTRRAARAAGWAMRAQEMVP
jgi:hypothetical protein